MMNDAGMPQVDPNVGGLGSDPSPETLDRESGGLGSNTVRENAEGAVHFLLATPPKQAVLLENQWRELGVACGFEHMALYQAVSSASHCFLKTVVRRAAGGVEHLLFITQTAGLTDNELIACMDTSSTPNMAGTIDSDTGIVTPE